MDRGLDDHNFIIAPPAGWFGSEVGKYSIPHVANAWYPLHTHNPASWIESQAIALVQTALDGLTTCGNCRQHAFDYVVKRPFDFSTREKYHDYLWRFHNAVNTRTCKAQFTFEEYRQQWLRWKPVDGTRIGFVAGCYECFGGTETFHQTLVPRLPGVVGFASQVEMRGDTEALGVPSAWGESAINSLVSQSDVIVSWAVDWRFRTRPKHLITVHHGSPADMEGTEIALQGDSIVAVSPDTAELLRSLTNKPVTYIPNAVDPTRLKPIHPVEIRPEIAGKKICLWSHRFSVDKRPRLAIEIAKYLPDDWHMVLVGRRNEPVETNDRVTILPPRHPGDWLSVASCFLSTSTTDGFGLSVAEAIAAGIPVVSSPVGIARRPGLAITVPIDARPIECAAAIVSSDRHVLPSRNLFSLSDHLAAWTSVVHTECLAE